MKRPPPIVNKLLYLTCLRGKEPAEVLLPTDRDRLVRRLHMAGWSDVEIATHTRMTTYTTVRVRSRLGLEPNAHEQGAA